MSAKIEVVESGDSFVPAMSKIVEYMERLAPLERETFIQYLTVRYVSLPRKAFETNLDRPRHKHPLIVSTPDICGGAARLIRTRIPVWVLERMRQLGVSESDILRSFPTLQSVDLVQAWSYAARYPLEIEKAIRENEEA